MSLSPTGMYSRDLVALKRVLGFPLQIKKTPTAPLGSEVAEITQGALANEIVYQISTQPWMIGGLYFTQYPRANADQGPRFSRASMLSFPFWTYVSQEGKLSIDSSVPKSGDPNPVFVCGHRLH